MRSRRLPDSAEAAARAAALLAVRWNDGNQLAHAAAWVREADRTRDPRLIADAYLHHVRTATVEAGERVTSQQRADFLAAQGRQVTEAARRLLDVERAGDAVRALEFGRAILLSQIFDDLDPLRRARLLAMGPSGAQLLADYLLARDGLAALLRAQYAERPPTTEPLAVGNSSYSLHFSHPVQVARGRLRSVRTEIDARTGPRLGSAARPSLFGRRPRPARLTDPMPELRALRSIATDGPLLYLASSPDPRDSGFAVLLGSDERCFSIRLPGLTDEQAQALLLRQQQAGGDFARVQREVGHVWSWLGDVLAPLAHHVAQESSLSVVPTGILAWFPIPTVVATLCAALLPSHARWPTVRMLPHARLLTRPAAPVSSHRLLTAVSPGTSRSLKLGEQQIGALTALYRRAGFRTSPSPVTTRAALLQELPGASVVHFHGHGTVSPMDGTMNALVLDDGKVTVRDLLLNGAARARLVVLAACNTHQGDQRLPDEGMGLPGALLQAGVAAVVAPQWPVREDSSTVLLRVFHDLWSAGVDGPRALTEAHRWISTATHQDLVARCPDVFRGALARRTPPRSRPFQAPAHFAPYVYVGL